MNRSHGRGPCPPPKGRDFLFGIVLCLVLLATAFATYAFLELDPLKRYVGADGGVVMRESASADFLNYLQHGPPTTTQIRQVEIMDHRGGTMSWRVDIRDPESPRAIVAPRNIRIPGMSQLMAFIVQPMRDALGWFMSQFVGGASAACTGGACFYVGGTGNFSDGAHWSLTSGGAACTCTPGATDTVTFDANSGVGTATQDNVPFTSGSVYLSNSSVVVSGSSHTWKVGGDWVNANNHFSQSTSLVEFTANSALTGSGSALTGCTTAVDFYDMTIDNGVTVTLHAHTDVNHVMTVNGTGAITGAFQMGFAVSAGALPPLTLTGAFGGFGTSTVVIAFVSPTLTGTYVWPGGSGSGGFFLLDCGTATAVITLQLTAALSTAGVLAINSEAAGGNSGTIELDTNSTFNYGLTSGNVIVGRLSTIVGRLRTYNSTVTVTGNVIIGQAGSVASYVVSGASGTWTVSSGFWSNYSTSASWSFASLIIFNASVTTTMTLCGTHCGSGGVEFSGGITFDSIATGSNSIIYGLYGANAGANSITWGGTLTVKQTGSSSGTTTLARGDLGLIGGSLAVNNKSIFPANDANVSVANVTMNSGGLITVTTGSWSVSGNWSDSSGGSPSGFNRGSGSVTFTGGSAIMNLASPASNNSYFYDLTVGLGATLTGNGPEADQTIFNRFTVNGTYIGGSPNDPQMGTFVYGLFTATPLVLGASADMTHSGYLYFQGGGAFTYSFPGGSYQHIGIGAADGLTVNLTGNVSTPFCAVGSDCAILFSATPDYAASAITVNANGHNISAGGTVFVGDIESSVALNMGSGTLSGFGVSATARAVINLQTGTINANPSWIYDPVALYISSNVTSGGAAGINAGSGTVNVYGKFKTYSVRDYVNFGSSQWTVTGDWQDISTSAKWNSGDLFSPAVVTFNGSSPQTIASGGKSFPHIRFTTMPNKNFTSSFADTGVSATVAVTMILTAGIVWTHFSFETLYVAAGADATHRLTLRSSVPGSQWTLNAIADRQATFIDVKDSNANPQPIIVCDGAGSVDSGNNVQWVFQPACPTIIMTGEQIFSMMQIFFFVAFLAGILVAALYVKRKRSEG